MKNAALFLVGFFAPALVVACIDSPEASGVSAGSSTGGAGATTTSTTSAAMGGGGATTSSGGGGAAYPAPHAPFPKVLKGSGSVLATPHLVPIYWMGDPDLDKTQAFLKS